MLLTLCEMQRILYQQELKRTSKNILHLYLQTFLHAMLLINNFKNPKTITKRKMFGKCYHALTVHACDQYRIINGRSINAESDERIFNIVKTLANKTSNHHAHNVISNVYIRYHVRKDFLDATRQNEILKTEAEITTLYKPIESKLQNSCINFEIIEKYLWEYQPMLEKIADFLVDDSCWSEVEYGVQFNDVISVQPDKRVSHFRSSSVIDELKSVEDCWKNVCLRDVDKLIPAYKPNRR